MSRLSERFALLRKSNRRALIPYIAAGDPQPWVTVPLMHAFVKEGADIIEIGVPFSDPMADGPVIQRAAERALKHGISMSHVFNMVREFRKQDAATPVVLMGYLNPIEAMGYERFAQEASVAGVDAALTVDLPPEESTDLTEALKKHGLDAIFLLAPTSSRERIARIAAAASGFIYYVSLRGVTGAAHLDVGEVGDKLKEIKRQTRLPVGVGFGINTPEMAAQMAQLADAVVVGSAIVKRMEALATEPERLLADVPLFLGSLRAAMDAVQNSEVSGVSR
jgi:tryptophan synthase alpha chain